MKIVERIADLRAARQGAGKVGLVPTMGFLHDGHLSLIRAARSASETVVMSLFVNPTQFGPSEDFEAYPRDTPRDLDLARETGVDIVFMPSTGEVYPPGFDTWVEAGKLAERWEGEHRPGHFRGVATVVVKLLQIVQPDLAYFGEKDYQQLLIVKKMVADLNLPVEIIPCPIVREASGLALSSRNAYLADDRRPRAAVLYRAMQRAQKLASSGVDDVSLLIAEMKMVVGQEPAAHLEYLAVVDRDSLQPTGQLGVEARILGAMGFDGVRLIDNAPLRLGTDDD